MTTYFKQGLDITGNVNVVGSVNVSETVTSNDIDVGDLLIYESYIQHSANNNSIDFNNGNNIKVTGYTGGVEIYANADGGTTPWVFATTGDLTLPDSGDINSTGSINWAGPTTGFGTEIGYTNQSGANSFYIKNTEDTRTWLFNQTAGTTTLPGSLTTPYITVGSNGTVTEIWTDSGRSIKLMTDVGGSNSSWLFDTTGNLTFPDTTVQSTAFTGVATPNNIISEYSGSSVIVVGGVQAERGNLTVRITDVSGTLGVEINYNPPATSSISIYKTTPVALNVTSGTINIAPGDTSWTLVDSASVPGDTIRFNVIDHSSHKIYNITVIARSMPILGTPGDAYCVIEELK